MFFKPTQKAFSLVELLITIAIIAVIAAASIGSLSAVQKSSRDAQRQSDLRLIQGALQQYYADVNKYPNSLITHLSNGSPLTNCSGRATPCTVSKTYLSKLPKDPTGSPYYYRPYVASVSQNCGFSNPDETGSEVGTCHKYILCAKLESPVSGSSCYDSNYNFQVSPL